MPRRRGLWRDFGGLTLLLQDGSRPGSGIATARAGFTQRRARTYVVNLGDMIARWTNDQYRSTLHRVVSISGRERYSVPFFFSGNGPSGRVPAHLPRARQGAALPTVTVEEHHREMYRRTYG